MPDSSPSAVAVIGGGLAGLAAAEAASRNGLRVEIFEQAARLGGRAGSFDESHNGAIVDYCPHAAMGCCTNFLEFCRRMGVADCFHRDNRLHFIGPDNRLRQFTPSPWLPAPFHLLPALAKLDFLSPNERRNLVRALRQLGRSRDGMKDNFEATFGDWLRSQNQSESAIERFWSIIILGALSETVENASHSAARKVFVDGFLASRAAGEMILPTVPLAEIFDHRAGKCLAGRGVKIHRRERVMWIESDENGRLSVVTPEGDAREFDHVVLSVPWHQAANLFPPALLDELPELKHVQGLSPSSIAAVHLWFDHPITSLPHAILVGKLSQWIFRGTQAENDKSLGYYQVVISAAHRLAVIKKDALLDRVRSELAQAFPDSQAANLLHSRVVVQPQAVFSMQPGMKKCRPSQTASLPNLFLAGDWTDTGWPGTMEGAVRSGYLAVENLLKYQGRPENILAPDLPRAFWTRRFVGC